MRTIIREQPAYSHRKLRSRKLRVKKLRIVLAQLNLCVGDIHYNLAKLMQAACTARDELSADVIVFPELSITGYPPEDLLLREDFITNASDALRLFIEKIHGIYCLVGHPLATQNGLLNACSLIYNGKIFSQYAKQHLPNYAIFDECRYFIPGHATEIVMIHGIPVGITICEDLWFDGPVKQAAAQGAQLILSPNASPYAIDKHALRETMLRQRTTSSHVPILYVNSVGGQDELVFDGGSMAIDQEGHICQFAGFFNEVLLPVDVEFNPISHKMDILSTAFSLPSENAQLYNALALGLRDYVQKNGFKGVLIGISGGIDSALTLAIAIDALGKERVEAIMLPSRYTSDFSMKQAMLLIKQAGVRHKTLSIESIVKNVEETLALSSESVTITQQNIQARCRGILLMALSNQSGYLVLNTTNRSEMAVGYGTLYGDMAGGFAVLKDVPKMRVYQLAAYRNKTDLIIPEAIIQRPPTAELAPNQKDEDSLPPYPILDAILECYLQNEESIEEIIARGFDESLVKKVVLFIHQSEYKRRQAPIGTRINEKAFGKDRRYPITIGCKNRL